MSITSKFKSFYNLYKNLKKDHQKFKDSNIRYYNFWALSKAEDCWFTKFINHRNINIDQKIINFLSVYGSPQTVWFVKRPKIFFSGENIFSKYFPAHNRYIKTYRKDYDLSLGFNYLEDKSYLRLPLWILYIIPPDADFQTIETLINQYNDPQLRLRENRKNFCANISRHDINGMRKSIIELLNPIHTVACAGDFLNNTRDLKEKYNDDKLKYLKTFKLNICPENSNDKGYVTEKLFEAITSGSIPIYWGSDNHPESTIINQEAVLFYDENNPQALFEKVQELYSDEKAYETFCHIKPFKDNAAEEIWEILNALESKIKAIL
jgi:glycosyltransferase involved in cell wall biosynthesis